MPPECFGFGGDHLSDAGFDEGEFLGGFGAVGELAGAVVAESGDAFEHLVSG